MEWAGDQPVLVLICNISLPDDDNDDIAEGPERFAEDDARDAVEAEGDPALHRKRSCLHV